MRIHLLSDLHNEFEVYEPATVDADVVVLAGDIDIGVKGVNWAREAFDCPVLYVPGNHEFYRGHLTHTLKKMRLAGCDRVQVLDRNAVVINGVRFLGAIMWTDFESTGNMPLASYQASTSMNDFKLIRTQNYRKIRPSDMITESMDTKRWLQNQLMLEHDGPTVVVTHHAPTLKSVIDDSRCASHMDAAYANRWDDLMGEHNMALWMHGHTHLPVDYDVAGTRVVSNPRGYPGEDTGFDQHLIIRL